jgi:signal transduction histidine kinase
MSVYAEGDPARANVVGSRDTQHFKAFALAVIGLNSVVLVIAGVHVPEHSAPNTVELLSWSLLVALAGLVPLGSGRSPSLAMDLPILLAAAYALGPFAAGLVALVGAFDIRELRREISLMRALWNRSQTSLSVVCASVVFGLFGGLGDWPLTPLIALLALAADAAVNYLIVGYGSSLRTQSPFLSSVRSMRIGSLSSFLLTYACFGFLGVLIAEAYSAFGMAGVVASVAPVTLGWQAFLHKVRLEDAEETLARSTVALRKVDERIAAERSEERARVAAALHDEVLQDLYNITIRAQVLRQDLLGGRLLDLEDDLPPVIRAAEIAVEDLREVIHGLRKPEIGHAGLLDTLALYTRHFESDTGLQVVLSLEPSVRSTPERELVLYQIAREAMTNSAKHANARTIWVTIQGVSGGIELVVEDDGCGFELAETPDGHHFGLSLMQERAAAIGGDLQIRSSPGSGTVVRLGLEGAISE